MDLWIIRILLFVAILVYAKDSRGNPRSGAPIPHYVSTEHQTVCSVCQAMHANKGFDDGNYWRELHREWEEEQAKRKTNNDKLSGHKDYFTGV